VFPAAAGVVVFLIFLVSSSRMFKWKPVHCESAEVQKIMNRVDTCLEAATVSQEFTKVGYQLVLVVEFLNRNICLSAHSAMAWLM